jgi:hypothetical protein
MGVSYRFRLLFMALDASSNYPNPISWGHHVSIRLASRLTKGTYSITALAAAFGEDTTVLLLVDEEAVVNENIHVNQVSRWASDCVILHVGPGGSVVYGLHPPFHVDKMHLVSICCLSFIDNLANG